MTLRESGPKPSLEPSARDPELWQALGQLTIYFAMLEGQLRFTIWTLLGTPDSKRGWDLADQEAAQIMMAGQPFSALVDKFCSLCKLRSADPSRLDLVRKDLARVSEARNRYVHSEWRIGDKPGAALRYRHTAKAQDGLKFSYEEVTPADIRELADEIGHVTLRVAFLMAGPEFQFHQHLWD